MYHVSYKQHFFKDLETQKPVHKRTHIYAIKNYLIWNPGYNTLKIGNTGLVRILFEGLWNLLGILLSNTN